MLTYDPNYKLKRKDLPWLLVVVALIWVFGTAFFHSPWEPFEPFVVAVVKGIIDNHSWFVPYISNAPYLDIQPFYFWLYSAFIKLFNIHNIYILANTVRILNTLIIFAVIITLAKIGSNLQAYKNGRTVVLILISSVGFINNAYQLSPQMINLLGFGLYIYALQLHRRLPGISSWILFVGLMLISISFNCEFILIALLMLLILPLIDRHWRTKSYLLTTVLGVFLFGTIFFLYAYQLNRVNPDFFNQWQFRYTKLGNFKHYNVLHQLLDVLNFLWWYTLPGWMLVIWSIYKRKLSLFKDKIIQLNIIFAAILILFAIFSGRTMGDTLFLIIIPFALIASLEIDSIRISIVSLLNWFSIFLFASIGIILWAGYLAFNFNWPVIDLLLKISQNFTYHFHWEQVVLAILITFIWVFLITRTHIRGREMLTNFASGVTFILVLFMTLWLPWFDSVLSFKPIVEGSLPYLDTKSCIATNGADTTQGALWYYYANTNLIPSFTNNIDYSVCNSAVVATENIKTIDQKQWQILWQAKRPIDKKVYYVVRRK